MAGSRSESVIDSVEEFWNIEMDLLSNDENINTAGVNNMRSIANCANDLISKNHGPEAYLTYQRLVKVLDFVWKGAQSLNNNVLKSDLLSNTLDGFKEVLKTLKLDLPPEDIVKGG